MEEFTEPRETLPRPIRNYRTMSFYLSLLVVSFSLAQAFQFCAKERETKTDICANIRMFANDTTQQTDVLVTLSARLEERRGWAAIAPGQRMSGALMFIVYPGEGTQGACRLSSGPFMPSAIAC